MTDTQRTIENLQGVHPDLQMVWHSTTLPYFAQVIDGLRTFPEQEEMYKVGASKTLNSRHLTGHAIDFAVWPFGGDKGVTWDLVERGVITRDQEIEIYQKCVKALKKTAKTLGIKCTFGADWGWDLGHVELEWESYPIEEQAPPKTAATSKTIATATAGFPIVVYMQSIFEELRTLTGNLLTGVDASIIGKIQTVALVCIVLFIVYERVKKIKRDGT